MTFQTLGHLKDQPPVIATLTENTNVKIDRVTVRGQITPPGEFPDEPSYEFIHVLKGRLVLEYEGVKEKVSLKAGEYAVKRPDQKTRADFSALNEETVYLKVSCQGERGKCPEFAGAVGREQIRHK